MPTYLVTGGAGFIGSHLCERLYQLGHQIIILDNVSTGAKANIIPSTEFIQGDIRDEALVKKIIQRVDGCFHLAAVASVMQANQEWVATHQINLTGTINLFNAARTKTIPIVYASSAAVYGNNPKLPLCETSAADPISAYGADKLACELHAKIASHIHQVPTIGLRLFNVYGPRQNPDSMYSGVITIFYNQLLQNQPITIFGSGKQGRDFIYVDDVVEHFIASMNNTQKNSAIYNVCTGKLTTIYELAERMARLLGKKLEISYQPQRLGDIESSYGDPTQAQQHLGISAKTPLREGLKKLITLLD